MKRPNIMFLVAEDTGRHQGCYGVSYAQTPNIDALAQEGCRFTNGFSTAPVCAPSRCTLVTGKYAFSLGSHHMRSTLLAPPRLFTQELRDAGYYVNWSNKTDFNFEPPEAFADDRCDWFEDLAAGKFKGRPWLLYHNFFVTHESHMWQEKWESVHKDLPDAQRTRPEDVTVPAYLPDTPEVRTDIARYFDNLAQQDREVAQALDALEKSGEADNTIVVYLADHGRGLVREKRWCYEAGIHLPLIIRWPGHIEPGAVDEQMVSWVDIAPTLLSLAGVPVPEDYQGRVFLGDAVSTPPREYCLAGRDRMDEIFDRVRTVRDDRYLYIRNFFPQLPYAQNNIYQGKQATTAVLRELHSQGRLGPEQALWMQPDKPVEELYDCQTDPDCVVNLAADPAHTERLRTMASALDAFLEEYGDLGTEPESALIAKGLVKDRMEEYRARLEALPEKYQIGSYRIPPLVMEEC